MNMAVALRLSLKPPCICRQITRNIQKREQLAKWQKQQIVGNTKFDRKKLSHKFLSVIEECKKKA